MLRNLLRLSPSGKIIAGTPEIGLDAAQIVSETGTGDQGPGLLYAAALANPGTQLSVNITSYSGTPGKLFVYENGSFLIDGEADGFYTIGFDWKAWTPTGGLTTGSDTATVRSGPSTIALAGIGVALVGGSAAASIDIASSGAGLVVQTGSGTPSATITLSAAALAQAAGQAGISPAILLAGAGAASAAGNASLATLLNALASGSAVAGGSATISGGAQGDIAGSGGAVVGGSSVLTITVGLQAAGSDTASGSAILQSAAQNDLAATGQSQTAGTAIPTLRIALGAAGQDTVTGTSIGTLTNAGQISAIGHAETSGTANQTITATLTAAGFVRAMGAGRLDMEVPLSAFGSATNTGSATLSQAPDYQPVLPLSLNAGVRRTTRLMAATRRSITLQNEVRHVIR